MGVIGVQGLYVVVLVMMKMAEGGDSNAAKQKPRRDIINSWIFCVSHLTAGWR